MTPRPKIPRISSHIGYRFGVGFGAKSRASRRKLASRRGLAWVQRAFVALSSMWTRDGLCAAISATAVGCTTILGDYEKVNEIDDGSVGADGGDECATSKGSWTLVGPMSVPRRYHAATTLLDGRILISGGMTAESGGTVLDSAEIFDPTTKSFRATKPMTSPRRQHQAVRLDDGRVLVVGGFATSSTPGDGLTSAEIFDSATETWTLTGQLSEGRGDFGCTKLKDGRVIVAGGAVIASASYRSSAEIFDPASGSWTNASNISNMAADLTLTTILDGRVVRAGGRVNSTQYPNVDIFDPRTATWAALPSLKEARAGHAASLLGDGRVLLVGGDTETTYEIVDPASGGSALGTLSASIPGATADLLDDGDCLVVGPSSAGLVEPSGEWISIDSPLAEADGHASARSGNTVLIMGGSTAAETWAIHSCM